ncbi:uncharacterized protein Dwil_GK25695 [Drosophila willistoni]|uniref:Uncharacterized protein n=1 Tax=Drosophila willistoni TaxID=7260 RepID=B4N3M9_DROWI|nr:uncharacterized protein LOC6645535 [Drosophila willistoni]EDW79234.2 uncharacterized protein Dwil_GK25695 [Drosophila willistoni]
MFEGISFLFLTALAFTAWSVLCYFDLIQQHKRLSDYQVELYTEHPGLTHVPQYCAKEISKGKSIPYRFFDVLINLGFVVGGCFILFKLLQWLELQAIWNPSRDESRPATTKVTLPALEQKEVVEQEKENGTELKDQLNVLQEQCSEMKELLRELRVSNSYTSQHETNSNRSTSSDAETDIIMWKSPIVSNSVKSISSNSSIDISSTLPAACRAEASLATSLSPPSPTTQNVFITNSHIHINGRVYISQRNVNIDLCRQASMYTRKQSEFLQVWDKFIAGPKEQPMLAGVRCNNLLM